MSKDKHPASYRNIMDVMSAPYISESRKTQTGANVVLRTLFISSVGQFTLRNQLRDATHEDIPTVFALRWNMKTLFPKNNALLNDLSNRKDVNRMQTM